MCRCTKARLEAVTSYLSVAQINQWWATSSPQATSAHVIVKFLSGIVSVALSIQCLEHLIDELKVSIYSVVISFHENNNKCRSLCVFDIKSSNMCQLANLGPLNVITFATYKHLSEISSIW